MFDKILIANRGEIACRIIQTAKRLGILTVAIYSEVDKNARHVRMADEAYCVGPAQAKHSYLNMNQILTIAKRANAQAIHPGYGFLSENAEFARLCEEQRIKFIGPSPKAIEAMGSKAKAKALMANAQVPIVPGYHGEDQSLERLLEEARRIGFPVLLKATAGGGGKGMRSVDDEKDFLDAVGSAQREALSAFGDEQVLIEKLLLKPRHIEVQVFADTHGHCVSLFERDCSVQRRHQKIIEEAPAPNITQNQREKLSKAAIDAAKAIDYVGAGTIEFLMDERGEFYFMEMNTRLQVEHPVTEMVSDLDLVEWQFMVASGQPLPPAPSKPHGHSIEVRIYAEDPNNQFLPVTGTVDYLDVPDESTQAVRVEYGIQQGDEISIYYDPMLAKLVAWGENRIQAIERLRHALNQFHVIGLKTNIAFLKHCLSHQAFTQGDVHTAFIDTHLQQLLLPKPRITSRELLMASLYHLLSRSQNPSDVWELKDAWRINGQAKENLVWQDENERLMVAVEHQSDGFSMTIDGKSYQVDGQLNKQLLRLSIDDYSFTATVVEANQQYHFFYQDKTFSVKPFNLASAYSKEDHSEGQLTAPMPGTVIALLTEPGQQVKSGEGLLIIEAMKMEHTIFAPVDGTITGIHYEVGDQVSEGDELVELAMLEEQ